MKSLISIVTVLLISSSLISAQPVWTVNPGDFQHSMTITGVLEIDGAESDDPADIIGVFYGGQCRGVAAPEYVSSIDRNLLFLMVYSNSSSGEQLSFKLYDASEDTLYDLLQQLPFASDASYGTPDTPYVFLYHTLNSQAEFLSFAIPQQTGSAIIDSANQSIDVTIPYGVETDNVIATFSISAGASAYIGGTLQQSGVTASDFSGPVTYTVISEDTITTKDWLVTVTPELPDTGADILSFYFVQQLSPAIINNVNHLITVEVMYGTNVTALIAGFELSTNATAYINAVSQISALTANNFTDTVHYSVMAQDGVHSQTWDIVVTVNNPFNHQTGILAFYVPGQTGASLIDTVNHSVNIETAAGTSLDSLTAFFTLSQGAGAKVNNVVQVSGVTSNDFSLPVIYIVTAEDGIAQQAWLVTVSVNSGASHHADILSYMFNEQVGITEIDTVTHSISVSVQAGTNPAALTAYFILTQGASATVNAIPQVSGSTVNNFSVPVVYLVTAEDAIIQQNWSVNVTVIPFSQANHILSYYLPGQVSADEIDTVNHSISIEVAAGTDLNGLIAFFSLSEGATATVNTVPQVSGITPNDFSNPVTYIVTGQDGASQQAWSVEVSTTASASGSHILSYFIPGQIEISQVDSLNHSVNIQLAAGTDLDSLMAFFTLSQGATAKVNGMAQVSGVTPNDFSNPIIYIVTAQDGVTQQAWLVTISVISVANHGAEILSYMFNEQVGLTIIDTVSHSVNALVHAGTDPSALRAYFILSSGATATVSSVPQQSGVSENDFTNTVLYVVMAEDGITQQVWSIYVDVIPYSPANHILSYYIPGQASATTIDTVAHSISIEVAAGMNLDNRIAFFTLSEGATAAVNALPQVSGITANDFNNPIIYVVTAQDGISQQSWSIDISASASASANHILSYYIPGQIGVSQVDSLAHLVSIEVAPGTDLESLTAFFTLAPGASAIVNSAPQVSGITSNDFSLPVIYIVTAQDGVTQQAWMVNVSVISTANHTAEILSYMFNEQVGITGIDTGAHSINATVMAGTDPSLLTAYFILSPGASAAINTVLQVSGISVCDYTSAVVYVVTAEDGTTQQAWTIHVTVVPYSAENHILNYFLPGQTGAAVIDTATHSISIELAPGTDLHSLIALFTLSEGATAKVNLVPQVTGVTANNFMSAVVYIVTAEDATTQQAWSINASVAPLSADVHILGYYIPGQQGVSIIDTTAHTISIDMPSGANVHSLAAFFTLSQGASAKVGTTVQQSGVTTNDFSSTVLYMVTAEDGITVQGWLINIAPELPDTGTNILSFYFIEQISPAIINTGDSVISVGVMYGTNLSSLIAGIELSSGAIVFVDSVLQISGSSANDFTDTVQYTVIAEDGVHSRTWIVVVTVNNPFNHQTGILSFYVPGQTGQAQIDSVNYTIMLQTASGTDIDNLTAFFTLSQGATAKVNNVAQVNGVTSNDFSFPVIYIVTAEDGILQQAWLVTVSMVSAAGHNAEILSFMFNEQTGLTDIDTAAHSINITVQAGTDPTSLVAHFILSPGATATVNTIAQVSGSSANNFIGTVIYVVTAEDGTTQQVWSVEVNVAPFSSENHILSYYLPGQTGATEIDTLNHTISIEVAAGMDIDSLVSFFTLPEGATATVNIVNQVSSVTANDFSNPVIYIVTAEDGISQQAWSINVSTMTPASGNHILSFFIAGQVGATIVDTVDHAVYIEMESVAGMDSLSAFFTLSQGATAEVNSLIQVSGVTSNDFFFPVIYIITAEDGFTQQAWLVTVSVISIASHEAEILSFMFNEQVGPTVIDTASHSITAVAQAGTDPASLAPYFILSPDASARVNNISQVSGVTETDFTNMVQYVVTAGDGTTQQVWSVQIDVIPFSSENQILNYFIPGQTGTVVMDTTTHFISIEMVAGTDLDSLVAYFSLSPGASASVASVAQLAGVTANDFSSVVIFLVTAEDGITQQAWTVYVSAPALSMQNHILSYYIPGQLGNSIIDSVAHTINIDVATGTDLMNLVAFFTLSHGASAKAGTVVQQSGVSANNFSGQVTYTVTAEDGSTAIDWQVTVIPELPDTGVEILAFYFIEQIAPANINTSEHLISVEVMYGTNVSSLIAGFELSPNAAAYLDTVAQLGGTTPNDFTDTVQYTVIAEDGIHSQTWDIVVTVNNPFDHDAEILAFYVPGQAGPTLIDTANHTIAIETATGVSLNSLTASFTLSHGATAKVNSIAQVSGVTPNDFSAPVTYLVTAEDGVLQQAWTVTISTTSAAGHSTEILSFMFNEQVGLTVIDTGAHSINVTVQAGTDVTSLAAHYILSSGATATVNSLLQISGVTLNDFTDTVPYIVTAEDGTTQQVWNVNVIVLPFSSANHILGFYLPGQTGATTIDTTNHTANVEVPAGLDLDSLIAFFTLPEGAVATVNSIPQTSSITANDFNTPVIYIITAEDGISQQAWIVGVSILSPATGNDILGYFVPGQTGISQVDNVNHTVSLEVAAGTGLNGLIAFFTLSPGATAEVSGIAQVSGVTANNFTFPVIYTVTAQDGVNQQAWEVTVIVNSAVNHHTEILSYMFNEQAGLTIIDTASHSITVTVQAATGLTSLAAHYILSPGATAMVNSLLQISGVSLNDFTDTVPYSVTAEDGITQQVWSVIVNVLPLSAANHILSYYLPGQTSVSVIDTLNHSINAEVAAGTNLDSLVAFFTLSEGAGVTANAIAQVSSVTPNDFSDPVIYVVTAEDGISQQAWNVEVSTTPPASGNHILSYFIPGQIGISEVDSLTHAISLEVAAGANLDSLTAFFSLSQGATAKINNISQVSGVTSNNFSLPVIYIVTAQDGVSQQAWLVNVSVTSAANHDAEILSFMFNEQVGLTVIDTVSHSVNAVVQAGTDPASLTAYFILSPGAIASVNTVTQESGISMNNFTNTVLYNVTAEDGITQQAWNVNVTVIPFSSANHILSYYLPDQAGASDIDTAGHSISIVMAAGMNLDSLVAFFTLSEGATATLNLVPQVTGVTANDFSNTIIYIVTAEDGVTQQAWSVNVNAASLSSENHILGFYIPGQTGISIIDTTGHSVSIAVPVGTNLHSLAAFFTLSEGASAQVGSVVQQSGVTMNDFSSPVLYMVTAEDGISIQGWIINVEDTAILPASEALITAFSFAEQASPAVIDPALSTVKISVVYNADVSDLTAFFTLSEGATAFVDSVIQISGVTANDYSDTLVYKVIAENGITFINWKVIVTVNLCNLANITGFQLPGQTGATMINPATATIYLSVAYNIDIDSIAAQFMLSPGADAFVADVPQVTGVSTNNFNIPVVYRVVAEDSITEKYWTVNVTRNNGIDDNSAMASISVYPNPASDFLFIENAGSANISIFSGEGKLIQDIRNSRNKLQISLKTYHPGVYFISISKDGKIMVQRIVVE